MDGLQPISLPDPGEIHVWITETDCGTWADDLEFLDEEERVRAERFYFPVHARRFRRGRIMRRAILGSYLDREPGSLRFELAEHGRPSLKPGQTGRAIIDFNMSNSGETVMLALASGHRIGVDVEVEKPMPDADAIAKGNFHPVEAGNVRGLDKTGDKLTAFFRCWTRKEAVVKALGNGLQMDLNGFLVGTDVRTEPFRPFYEPGFEGRRDWWVADFSRIPVYAAIAMDARPDCMIIRRWKR